MNRLPTRFSMAISTVLGVIAVIGITTLFSYIGQQGATPRVSRPHTPPHPARPAERERAADTLRFALAPVVSPLSAYPQFRKLLDAVERDVGIPIELITRSTYSEVAEILRNREADMGFVCTATYVLAREEWNAEILAVPVMHGKKTYQSFVIVGADAPIDSLAQLRGRTLAYTDEQSTSGWLYLATEIAALGADPHTFFASRTHTASHDRAIYAVAMGTADAAAVDSAVYLGMSARIRNKTKIIRRSAPFPMSPIVIHPTVDARLKRLLRRAFITVHRHAANRPILDALGFDRFTTESPASYRVVERIVHAARNLEARRAPRATASSTQP